MTGAGVAALVGIMLRPKVVGNNKLKVVAFASPPIIDHKSALDCRDFVTTIVNKSDVIPRSSLANLAVLRCLLLDSVRPKLHEKGLAPKDFTSTTALLYYLTNKSDDEANESSWIMTAQEAHDSLEKALAKVPIDDKQHLYVPGKVVFLYKLWSKKRMTNEDEKAADGARIIEPTDHILRHLDLDLTMVTDHLSASYRAAIADLVDSSTPSI